MLCIHCHLFREEYLRNVVHELDGIIRTNGKNSTSLGTQWEAIPDRCTDTIGHWWMNAKQRVSIHFFCFINPVKWQSTGSTKWGMAYPTSLSIASMEAAFYLQKWWVLLKEKDFWSNCKFEEKRVSFYQICNEGSQYYRSIRRATILTLNHHEVYHLFEESKNTGRMSSQWS